MPADAEPVTLRSDVRVLAQQLEKLKPGRALTTRQVLRWRDRFADLAAADRRAVAIELVAIGVALERIRGAGAAAVLAQIIYWVIDLVGDVAAASDLFVKGGLKRSVTEGGGRRAPVAQAADDSLWK